MSGALMNCSAPPAYAASSDSWTVIDSLRFDACPAPMSTW